MTPVFASEKRTSVEQTGSKEQGRGKKEIKIEISFLEVLPPSMRNQSRLGSGGGGGRLHIAGRSQIECCWVPAQ